MDILLNLPPDVEPQYWTSPSTQQQLKQADTLGLAMGILSNLLMLAIFPRPAARVYHAIIVSTQAAQLLWLWARPASYMRARFYINWAQRMRVLLGMTLAFARKPTDAGFQGVAQSLGSPGGEMRVFALILLSWPCINILASLNHSLPFKSHLVLTTVLCISHTVAGMPHQTHAIKRYGLQGWAESSCWLFEFLFFGPSVTHPHLLGDMCHGRHTVSLVTGGVFMVLAYLGPLHVVYWIERLSKATFLKGKGVPQAPEPRVARPLVAACFYACCVLLWNALALLHPLLLARPHLMPFPGWR